MSDTNSIADPKPAAASTQAAANAAASETDVYAIHGADPEVLAYAMANTRAPRSP